MAKELKDLQKLIEEKAEKRFNEDYFRDVAGIQNSNLFKHIKNPQMFKCKRYSGSEEMQSAFWAFSQGYGFYERLKEYWLPIYISKEAEMFMEEVERIKADVDGLLNNQYAAELGM